MATQETIASEETPSQIGMNTIVVAIDFSEISLRALKYSGLIAHHFKSTVYGAHIVPAEAYRFARPESVETILRQCNQFAKERIGTMFAQAGLSVNDRQILVGAGDVCSVLVDTLRQLHAELLVVATTGRKGVRKILLGSVAEELIRLSPCPVLSIGPDVPDEAPAKIEHIVYGIDFSPESLDAAPHAFWLARHFAAQLIVVHVAREPQESPELVKRLLTAELQQRIWPDAGPMEPEYVVRFGDAAVGILEAARERNAGLIVIGTRGAGAFTRARTHFGSTAHEIVCKASCPVLTVCESEEER